MSADMSRGADGHTVVDDTWNHLDMTTEFEIYDPPTDGISALQFSRWDTHRLLATSWDSSVYIYDCSGNVAVNKFSVGAALLDGCFSARDRNIAYAAGLGRQIHRLDLTTGQSLNFGQHDDAIKAIAHCSDSGLLFSGSWDKTVGVWDERAQTPTLAMASATSTSTPPVHSLALPDKVYSMDMNEQTHLLLVATASRHIYLYDTRNLHQPLQKRESSLKYQTRRVCFFPDGQGFICASIEGRVAVDFVDPSPEAQQGRYAFKCHRQPTSPDPTTGLPMEVVHPVNALAYHPTLNCFMTGGSDGVVNSWDRINRKRIRQFPKYPTGISALAVSRDGAHLAVGVSYSYEEGEKDHPPESIFIRKLEDSDVKSKSVLNG